MKGVLSKLHDKLSMLNSEIKQIIDEVSQEDLLTVHNEGVLRSNKTQKSIFLK